MDQTSLKSDKKPIKRNEHMVILSRDHHAGLLFCWKIKEGLKRGADILRINKYVQFFWEQHLKEHFHEEESLLFNKIDNDLTKQAKHEHQLLVKWFNKIIKDEINSVGEYLLFTELLINHIRFEERVLFPYLEKQLSNNTLVSIGTALTQGHQTPFNDNYPDEFWVKKI
jgi:hemerythrin-like domain-containing protein